MQKKSFSRFLTDNIGFLFIVPWLIGFLVFKVYPFASSLYYSFTNYDLFTGITKTGLMNYQKIFTDEDIVRAFAVTFKYAIFDVPLKLAFALFIAYILNFKLKGVNFFRYCLLHSLYPGRFHCHCDSVESSIQYRRSDQYRNWNVRHGAD